MFRKSIIIATFVLGSLLLSSYSWILYGPNGIKANKLCLSWSNHGIICVDSGMYLVTDFYSPTWEFFSFPAQGAIQFNMDSLLVIHSEGSWSDGIYTFDLQTHEFSPVEYCLNPNFITYTGKYYVGHEYGLLESTDGLVWSEVVAFNYKTCLDMSVLGYSDLAVATDTISNNVLYSEDNGINWHQLTGDFKITELVALNYRVGGLCKSGVMPGFYLSDGEDWELEYNDYEINTIGCDNIRNPFFGYDTLQVYSEGIARYHFTQPYGTLEFFNEGLPSLNINHITSHPSWVGGNIIFCCTDNGVFYSYDFAVGIRKIAEEVLQIGLSPNPFTTSTTLSYTLDKPQHVHITIYNLQGQIVFMMQEKQDKGVQKVEWNAEGLPSGMYYFRISDNSERIGSGKLLKY